MALHEIVTAPPPADASPRVAKTGGNALPVAGVLTGLSAIAASSCCAIPLALASLGAGAGVFGALEDLASWRVPLLVASGFVVAIAWLMWWRAPLAACEIGSACVRRPRSRVTLPILLIATAMLATAAGWDYIEVPLLKLMLAS
ncbi:hypothetical protein GCM10007874_08380 [Labrys miyagiensis]|uniref:Mercuric transport protein MerT n=1 Tax=Labrys miyagiensis TaxID=346912 RepID=A0ABQ6CBR4_9HYPH|nr:hypothetical protein GCM10007874_08380 [Labrys miyagiensis]